MPRKAQFTKEDIINVSISLIRKHGPEALSARSICKEMGCSVSPLFTTYKNMDEITQDVRSAAEKVFSDYVADVCEYVPAFKEFGMRLVRFAREESNLFHYLFLDKSLRSEAADQKAMECLEGIEREFGLDDAQAKLLYRQLWPLSSGVAQLSSRNPDKFSDDLVSDILSTQFTSLMVFIKSGRPVVNIIPHLAKEGERVQLRPWMDSDAAVLFKYASDPELGPRAGWPPHQSEQESLEVIRKFFHNDSTWAIVLKETGAIVGCVGYLPSKNSNIPIGADEAEVGYWVARPYWDQGICTEALEIVIDFCRRVKHHRALWGEHFLDNPASGRVMEKCGFTDTGIRTNCEKLEVGADKPTRVLKLEF